MSALGLSGKYSYLSHTSDNASYRSVSIYRANDRLIVEAACCYVLAYFHLYVSPNP